MDTTPTALPMSVAIFPEGNVKFLAPEGEDPGKANDEPKNWVASGVSNSEEFPGHGRGTPGKPPMTKSDFAIGFRSFAGKVQIEATQEIKDLRVSGDMAYSWSHLTVAMTSLETGNRTERAGHVLTVLRKSPSGTWLLARDANLMAAGK